MSSAEYPVEVQPEFLEKITRASPMLALSELIWNGLDADASQVKVTFQPDKMGNVYSITVQDNGTGMPWSEAPMLFRNLGGSWKRLTTRTKNASRFLHGREGRGRFKAFALGSHVEWNVTYQKGEQLWSYRIKVRLDNIKVIEITEERIAATGSTHGVSLTIFNLHRDFSFLDSEASQQTLTEIFALYLSDYRDVEVLFLGKSLDPDDVIASRAKIPLPAIMFQGKLQSSYLELIEWQSITERNLYLCNYVGFPLHSVEKRFHLSGYFFSAYLKSELLSALQEEGIADLAEMRPEVNQLISTSASEIKSYFRQRAAEEAKTVVDVWKDEKIYPYKDEPKTQSEEIERQVFDIVAVKVAQHLPDFSDFSKKSQAYQLRLLKQAIETGPEELQLILEEVLNLPSRMQSDLAGLLRDTSLTNVISSAKIVADRLKFITGLDALLFDEEKAVLKERSQLHKIIEDNCWIFGEEYNLSVSDQSLTEVLRKHKKFLKQDLVIDEPVKHVTKKRGIIDLMLSRTTRRHRAEGIEHLIIELKAPKVCLGSAEVSQIEQYAASVSQDERFRDQGCKWTFWVISDDYDDFVKFRLSQNKDGSLHNSDGMTIWVKTWASVISDNKARLQFFQEHLNYRTDRTEAMISLKDKYQKLFVDVKVDEGASPVPENDNNLEPRKKGRKKKQIV